MLVLTRRKNQRIRFPGLGISVDILDVRGSNVKIGVDAPLEVRILRDEVEGHEGEEHKPAAKPRSRKEPTVFRLPNKVRHELRNTLHELSLMMHVYKKRAEKLQLAGEEEAGEDAISTEQMFEAIVGRLKGLSSHTALSKRGVVDAQPECGATALVVDDNDNERQLLAGFLQMCDYKVRTAANGLEAMEMLNKGPLPKVILLDMHMPHCDGREFLRQVRSVDQWDSIHVFVVSGSEANDHGLSESDGYTHWHQKPLDPRLVVDELNRIEARSTAREPRTAVPRSTVV